MGNDNNTIMYTELLNKYIEKKKNSREKSDFKVWIFYLVFEIIFLIGEVTTIAIDWDIYISLAFFAGVILFAFLAWNNWKIEEKNYYFLNDNKIEETKNLLESNGYKKTAYDILIEESKEYEKYVKPLDEMYEIFSKSIGVFLFPVALYAYNNALVKGVESNSVIDVIKLLLSNSPAILGVWLAIYVILAIVHIIIASKRDDKRYSRMLRQEVYLLKRVNL